MTHPLRKWLCASLICLATVCFARPVSGQALPPTIEQSASILVFPKIIADGQRDTLVQITNTTNFENHLLCFYVDSRGCVQTNFDLVLSPQQPTHWVASRGRAVDDGDAACSPGNASCDGAGEDPGLIPPVVPGFRGALICVDVDISGFPISANALRGRALLKDLVSGDVSSYDALGLLGLPTNDGDQTLCLGDETTPSCPLGAEYVGCPSRWDLPQVADGAEDPLVGGGSSVDTELSIVPCAQNFLLALPTVVVLQVKVTNELEEVLSTSTSVTCWADLSLSSLGLAGLVGTESAKTNIEPAPSSGGIFVVAEQSHRTGGASAASAAVQVHHEGALSSSQRITLP